MEVNYQELFKQQQEGIDIGLEPVETTFTDMVKSTLHAILSGDKDGEMQHRSALKSEYRVSDSQITRELFKPSQPLKLPLPRSPLTAWI